MGGVTEAEGRGLGSETGILRTGSPPFAHSFPGPGDARGIPYGPGGASRRLWTKRGLPRSTPGRKSEGPPEAGLRAGQQEEVGATGNLVGGPDAAGSLAASARVEHAPSSRWSPWAYGPQHYRRAITPA